MTILCCYTKLHEKTAESLAKYAPETVFADVWGDPFNYWKELEKHWDEKEDLIIIEHDIEIHDKVIDEFRRCASLWCTFPYDHFHEDKGIRTLTMSLGCTKLTYEARQIARPEDLANQVEIYCWACNLGSKIDGFPACWQHLDAKLAAWLEFNDVHPCVHNPPVTHYRTLES